MVTKHHSIHAYAAFDARISKVERWIVPQIHPVLGCDAGTVRHRLIQRLIELTLAPFVSQLAQHLRQNEPFLHPEGACLNLNGITINTQSGKVTLTALLLMRACIDFGAHWLHALYSILFIGTCAPRGKATLVFGVGGESLFYGDDDQRFAEYCAKGPIGPLSSASRLIVQDLTHKGSYSDARLSYARHPFVQLARETRLSWPERLSLLGRHLIIPARYVWGIVRCRHLALLSRDYAVAPLLAALDRAGQIEAIVFTNSNYSIQPLWARAPRTYATHMVWYSQNVIPFVMKADDFAADLPNYRYMQVDTHWVWTEGFRRYLLERGGRLQCAEVVGPVMWYLPGTLGKNVTASFNVAVFDVTPISDAYAESIGLLGNYYCPSTAIGFLEDVLKATAVLRGLDAVECKVNLKHKRQYSPTHDRRYIELVASRSEDGQVKLAPFNTDIYKFVAESDVVVVIPNSSPACIASALGIPCIYFDPTEEMRPNFEPAQGVSFASGVAALTEQLANTYKAKRLRMFGNPNEAEMQ
ncbi:polysaccharide biosynthesis PFTS motif protein [Rhodoferax sp. TS-BS-61-7]|uniref:polysaccharide biosynthesis PFTS motif protein n=1 Tax=Rhodoferax sp. TS-BS-61-7 TaxID=2094194 RepID=UPI0011B0CE32|nr:polysaccharide biosynthesis PFTS motif protein [Rhodoferax sp. TS-BS-61-7]